MPIIIRETTIRADLSGKEPDKQGTDQSKPDEQKSSSIIRPIIEERILQILLRNEKMRDER